MDPCFLNCQSFSAVLDALQDGVTIYDRNSTLIWINRKACQIMGMPRAELIGRNVSEISTLPTVRAIMAPEFAGRSLTEIRQRYKRLKDYTSPGYMGLPTVSNCSTWARTCVTNTARSNMPLRPFVM